MSEMLMEMGGIGDGIVAANIHESEAKKGVKIF